MKPLHFSSFALFAVSCLLFPVARLSAQTLYVPSGTSGIGSSSTGNVGIGTSSPAGRLQVDIAAGGYNSIFNVASNTGALLAFQVGGADKGYLMWNVNDAGSGPGTSMHLQSIQGKLQLFDNTGTGINISGGNVGIGTTTPGQPLEVAGQILSSTASGGSLALNGNNTTAQPAIFFERSGSSVWLAGLTSDASASFVINNGYGGGTVMAMTPSGNVGIGTSAPSYKLAVNGTVRAKEVIVDTGWSDYVFDESYKLKGLSETEAYIKAEHHLPGIPSAQEVAEHGVSMGEMQSKLLAKIEELTLHLIRIEKENQVLADQNHALHERMSALEHQR